MFRIIYKWLIFSVILLIIMVVVIIAFLGRTKPKEVSNYVSTPKNVPSPGASSLSEQVRPVQLVVADLASKLQIPSSLVQVVSVQKVDWPDSSLGLPKPGYLYTQVITSGYKVMLNVQGKNYIYHTDLGNNFVEEASQ